MRNVKAYANLGSTVSADGPAPNGAGTSVDAGLDKCYRIYKAIYLLAHISLWPVT